MPRDDLPAFADLRRRYPAPDASDEDSASAPVISLGHAIGAGDDPLHVLSYLRGLGITVATLEDLHAGIAGLPDEEELAAFRCREGIAVVVASDGVWVLFTDWPAP